MSAGKLGHLGAVQALYADHHTWLCGWLRRKLGCPNNAADLAQDTFLRIIASTATPALREPRAYLTTIARGLVIDLWRRQDLERAYLEAIAALPESQVPSPETRMLLLETLAEIDALLDGLQARARSAFLLSRLEGLSYSDIAERLGVSLSSVEKDMALAIRHCLNARGKI